MSADSVVHDRTFLIQYNNSSMDLLLTECILLAALLLTFLSDSEKSLIDHWFPFPAYIRSCFIILSTSLLGRLTKHAQLLSPNAGIQYDIDIFSSNLGYEPCLL